MNNYMILTTTTNGDHPPNQHFLHRTQSCPSVASRANSGTNNNHDADDGPPAPNAIIFYFHGLFLHTGVDAEMDLCKYIAASNGYYVVAFDHTGHGRSASDADRGHVGDWHWFIDDAMTVINITLTATRKQWPNVPFFLFGISLGGCVALNTALKLQEDKDTFKNFLGAVLIAPAIYDNIRPDEWVVDALRLVNTVGGGYLALGPAAEVNHFGSVEAYDEFKNDKFCYSGRLRLSMGHSLLSLTEHTQHIISNVNFPFCLIHSDDDNVVKVQGSRELYKVSQTLQSDKVYYEYSNMGHNVLNSPGGLDKCFSWLQQRITQPQSQ